MKVKLKTMKNSLGTPEREIFTRLLWWSTLDGENFQGVKQYRKWSCWDWDWATVDFLSRAPGKYIERFKDIKFQIKTRKPESPVECEASCRYLGMAKEEFLPYKKVGQMIAKDTRLMEELRSALDIERCNVLQGDMLDQFSEMATELP